MNTIQRIQDWHAAARPNPTDDDFNVQLGCHLEEIAEMLECLIGKDEDSDDHLHGVFLVIGELSNALKSGKVVAAIPPEHRKEFLDSLADQIVTGVGVGHCAKMGVVEATDEVNLSNWSKFDPDTGKPIFNEHGKIAKGPAYTPPNLEGLY